MVSLKLGGRIEVQIESMKSALYYGIGNGLDLPKILCNLKLICRHLDTEAAGQTFNLKLTTYNFQMKFLLTPLLLLSLTSHAQDEYYLLTGTYTGGKSKGIYVHTFNTKTGMTRELSVMDASNPSYIAASADGRFVYAVHEDGQEAGGGKISAYAFDASTGKLSLINTQSTEGDHPCYVTAHPSGKLVVAGNYTGGNVAAFTVGSDGSLGKASSFQHMGSSINKERQEKPHVHCTVFAPDAKQLWVADLGIDKLVPYEANTESYQLSTSRTEAINLEPGSGPRHLTFDPAGKWSCLPWRTVGSGICGSVCGRHRNGHDLGGPRQDQWPRVLYHEGYGQ